MTQEDALARLAEIEEKIERLETESKVLGHYLAFAPVDVRFPIWDQFVERSNNNAREFVAVLRELGRNQEADDEEATLGLMEEFMSAIRKLIGTLPIAPKERLGQGL